MEGGWRSSQFKAIPSLLPLVLPHPQNCGSLGCSEQGEGGSSGRAPCSLPPSSGPPPCPVPLLTPLSSLPLSLISSLPLRLSARRNQNFQALPLTNPGDFFFVVLGFFVPSSGRKVGRRSPCAPPAGWEGERRCVPAGKGKGMRAPRPFFHPFYPQKLAPQGCSLGA